MKQQKKIYQIFISNNGKVYQPVIKDSVKITWQRGFRAGVLEFDVVKDDVIDYQEGNPVTFSVDGNMIFKGYVFKKSRDKKQVISTICYDQIRYLKSKDTYQYRSMTMSDLLKKICKDRNLQVGEIEDTSYKIPKRIEKSQEYLNMIKVANDITLSQTGKIFTLFDDKGKICLKSFDKMIVDYPISYDNIVDFSYETSIDDRTYNRVVVYLVDDEGRLVKKVVKQDENNIARWGVLEYTITTNNAEDIENKASQILEVLNRKYRSLTIKNAIGDVRIRAGSVIPVEMMAIGDININSYMLVEKVTHSFFDDGHFMDLEVMNKDIQKIGDVEGIISDKESEIKKSKMLQGSGNYHGDAPNEQIRNMLDSAYSMLGSNYSQAKRGTGNYTDCSYFVWKAMKDAGFDVPKRPWATNTMLSSGLFRPISFNELRPGDVGIKAKTPGKNNGHTVIALSKNEIIHSTPPRAKKSPMGKYKNYQFYRPIS